LWSKTEEEEEDEDLDKDQGEAVLEEHVSIVVKKGIRLMNSINAKEGQVGELKAMQELYM